jgi:hypothetical protein
MDKLPFVCVWNVFLLDDMFMFDCLCLASLNKENSAEIFNFGIHT